MPLTRRPSKIVCIGRNYRAHAAELGNDVPAEPLFFLKPPSSLLSGSQPIVVPEDVGRVDYEGEIGILIGRDARSVPEAEAWNYVSAVLPVNDVTARDLQKKDSQWTRAKGFDTFCPVGEPVPIERVDPSRLEVITRVNGTERQHGRAADMAFSIPFLIAYVSRIMTLEAGDILATGTPEGIGPLSPGDVVEVEIPGVGVLKNPVVAEAAVAGAPAA
jgi:2-keto-4-pentenoate hydratase/2-oxohepta-3-ene-1,7-dioic acid hydratase in catechol pathway